MIPAIEDAVAIAVAETRAGQPGAADRDLAPRFIGAAIGGIRYAVATDGNRGNHGRVAGQDAVPARVRVVAISDAVAITIRRRRFGCGHRKDAEAAGSPGYRLADKPVPAAAPTCAWRCWLASEHGPMLLHGERDAIRPSTVVLRTTSGPIASGARHRNTRGRDA